MGNKALDYTALTIGIIGAVNWGLIGFFNFNLVAFLYVHGHDFSMDVGYHVHAVGAGHRTAEGQLLLYGLFCQRRHIHHDSRALAAAPKL